MARERAAKDTITLGRINGVYGVRGWVRIHSYCRPIENILSYDLWSVGDDEAGWQSIRVVDGRRHGKGLVVQLDGIENREQALGLQHKSIVISRRQLPSPGKNEYYWVDLVGMQVVSISAGELGKVSELIATGANDVLVVEGDERHLVPWLYGSIVREVDVDKGRITVDWDGEFI